MDSTREERNMDEFDLLRIQINVSVVADVVIARTLEDLEGFHHPLFGKMVKGSGLGYIPTNFICFMTDKYSIFTTKPEQYDAVVWLIWSACSEQQRRDIQKLVKILIDENELNRTERFPATKEGRFAPRAIHPRESLGSSSDSSRQAL